jgi:nitrate reductase cytochrome c-type subunit
MKSAWPLIIAAGGIILLLFFLSSSGKKPPMIPSDSAHRGITTQEGCAACHAAGMSSPLKENHPPKEQCLICHKSANGRTGGQARS